MRLRRSAELYEQAQRYLPGGVDSPVRAFKAVGGHPIFIKQGLGSKLYDEDGNEFIDYVCSWGPIILGHAHPRVVQALKRAIERGAGFGAPTELETALAKMICSAMPSIEMVRFVNSGTEAVMSALRLARAFSAREKVVKFSGCYHGHSDGMLVEAGSGLATLGMPSSPGVPSSYAQNTLVAPYNNIAAVTQLFERYGEEIAAIIVEPVAANMGVVPPEPGYLQALRRLTEENNALLIFDEVITGFRVAYGGAASLYGVNPDLTCLGKVIGGGLPIGAYGGRRQIMEMVSPSGPVYQAGTLSGNPLSITAGIETLAILSLPQTYDQLEQKASLVAQGLEKAATEAQASIFISRVESIFTVFFSPKRVSDYDTALSADTAAYSRFFHQMLSSGIYMPPSQFEASFVSLAHSEEDIQATIEAAKKAFAVLGQSF